MSRPTRRIGRRKHKKCSKVPRKQTRKQPALINDDPDEGIRQAKRRVRQSVPKIIQSLEEKAEHGSSTHAKFLFEFAGVEFGAEKSAEEDSLSRTLLERLDEMQRQWREQYGTDFPPYGEATGRKVE